MVNICYHSIIASKAWGDKRCQWCGKYLEAGDNIALIIPDSESKQKYKKLSKNYIMHIDEYKELVKTCNDSDELYSILGTHAMPRTASITELEQQELDAVELVCKKRGFYIKTNSGHTYRFRMRGSSLTIEYNYKTKSIQAKSKARTNVIESLYLNRLAGMIGADVDAMLGRAPREILDPNKVIQKAIQGVTDM